MKIEKVNDHQIRCTLSKKELEKRDLKLSEIAYGNEKVKTLFRDMMRQASFQLGFEAEDIPLMIEVIPFQECAVIIITKVEDPEELDTRFSKFAPSLKDDDEEYTSFGDVLNSITENANDVLDLFSKIQERQTELPASLPDQAALASDTKTPSMRLYTFETLNEVIRAAHVMTSYRGKNSLYKNTVKNNYVLVISVGDHTPEEFVSYCGLLSEYAVGERYTPAAVAYMDEHFESIILADALQNLALL